MTLHQRNTLQNLSYHAEHFNAALEALNNMSLEERTEVIKGSWAAEPVAEKITGLRELWIKAVALIETVNETTVTV